MILTVYLDESGTPGTCNSASPLSSGTTTTKTSTAPGPHPKRLVKDTKYGVCFRACLAFAPSFIASELKLAGQGALAEPTRIDFAFEGGHANAGDARGLFELCKKDALPEWQHRV